MLYNVNKSSFMLVFEDPNGTQYINWAKKIFARNKQFNRKMKHFNETV